MGISLIDLFANIFGIIMWIGIIYVIFHPLFKYFKKEKILKLWRVGTTTPIQRIGLIVLIIGISSFASWLFKREIALEEIFNSYYFPKSRDFIFFHLYLYFIPIGLLMTWGHPLIDKVKQWIFNQKPDKLVNNYNQLPKHLHFRDNITAFKFASSISVAELLPKKISIGIVSEVMESQYENPFFIIHLANTSGSVVVGGFNDKYASSIHAGDLVYWAFAETVEYDIYPEIKAVGYIIVTAQPEFDPQSQKWVLKQDLTK